MASVRAMRLLNAIGAGTLTGAQLDALLADPTRLEDFKSLFLLPGQSRRLWLSQTSMTAVAASSTAMTAVAASSTAMTAVIASSTAMAAVVASSTAMTAVAASSTAMSAVIASSTAMAAVVASSTAMAAVVASSAAKMAIFGSDVALAAIAASSTALAALRGASGYAVIDKTAASGAQTVPGPAAGQSYILVGVSCSNATQSITNLTTLRTGSARPVTAPSAAGATNAQATTLCTPLNGPITFTTSSATGFAWYFGLLRCDV